MTGQKRTIVSLFRHKIDNHGRMEDEDKKTRAIAGRSGDEDVRLPDGSLPSRLVATLHLPLSPVEHCRRHEGFLWRSHLVPRQPRSPHLPKLKPQGKSV